MSAVEQSAPLSPIRFIDPTVLSKIENLELLSRTVVEGFVQGLHKSPFLGFSVDFAEYRQYQPGDVMRSIDWNVYGRLDKLYVKLFEGETIPTFTSCSMPAVRWRTDPAKSRRWSTRST